MRFIAVALIVLFALLPNPGSASSTGQNSPADAGGIKAKAVGVSETRERRLDDKGRGMFAGLKVTLRFDGPVARGVSKIGRLKVTEATDDAGTDLRDKDQLRWCEQLQDVSRFGQSEKEKAAGVFDYDLRLGLPARSAKAVKNLKGEVQVLAGGREVVVSLPAVRKLAGRPVEDADLKAAGITLKVNASPSGKKNSIEAELTGDFDAIREVKVLSPDGSNKMAGSWWSESGGKRTVSYMLSEPLEDDAARLELRIVVGQKTLSVPVEIADLALP
jgi:hypothetical protein